MAESEAEFLARMRIVDPRRRSKAYEPLPEVDMSRPAPKPIGHDVPVVLVERGGHLVGRRRRTPADVLGENLRVHRFPRRTRHLAIVIGDGEPETPDLPHEAERWRPGGAKVPR